ncbi:hypothetical protein C2E23DRAFT_814112 [Lenzites betulinus]|nr:hypothetical protein C2E23DRAFT_814112 [Lenzites betulinus]
MYVRAICRWPAADVWMRSCECACSLRPTRRGGDSELPTLSSQKNPTYALRGLQHANANPHCASACRHTPSPQKNSKEEDDRG